MPAGGSYAAGPPGFGEPMRILTSLVLTAMVAALFWQAATGATMGIYPLVLTGGALLCCLAYVAGSVLRRTPDGPVEDGEAASFFAAPLRVAAFLIVWAAYVALLPRLGFIIASWLALYASSIVTSGRLGLRTGLYCALFIAVLAVLLKVALYVPVPQGTLDRYLDTLLYGLF